MTPAKLKLEQAISNASDAASADFAAMGRTQVQMAFNRVLERLRAEGYVIVPRAPTKQMCEDGAGATDSHLCQLVAETWDCMIETWLAELSK